MSTRVRSRPQRLQNEQEEEYLHLLDEQEEEHLHVLDASVLLYAMSLSSQPAEFDPDNSSGDDSDGDYEEEQEEAEEKKVWGSDPFDEHHAGGLTSPSS